MATVVIQKREREEGASYVITYKDPGSGKKRYFKTFRKAKEAQQAANDLRYLIDNGKPLKESTVNKKANLLTFEEVAEQQIIDWQRRLQEKDLEAETVNEYIGRTRRISIDLGKKLLCEITGDDIRDYRGNIAKEKSNVSSNRSLFMIKQVFKKGMELNAIHENPAEGIRALSEKHHMRNKYQQPHEINTLVEATQQTKSKFYMPAVILLAVEHGASKQEILTLKWSDINFDHDGRGIIRFYRTKNRHENTEYLMPRTKEALLKWREHLVVARRRKKVVPFDDYAICHLDGTGRKGFSSAWEKVRKEAGFEGLHFHDNRHTFCSNVALSGGDLKEISEMIGHSDISMTDRYTHLTGLRKLYRQEKLAEHYGSTGAGLGATGEHIGNTGRVFDPRNEKTAK
jgi:site-specific recombinase XerD